MLATPSGESRGVRVPSTRKRCRFREPPCARVRTADHCAMARPLRGMVVAITGASAGIGRALAVELAARGASLALAARRCDRLDALASTLCVPVLTHATDVADPIQCAAFIAATQARFGRLDTLVCNAGYGLLKGAIETSSDEWKALFATNLHGTLDCIRAALPALRAQEPRAGWRGQIMIVSSILGRRASPWTGAYSATKAAQLSLAEALRGELRAARIAVTSVHPIGTRTEFLDVAAQGRAQVAADERFSQSAEHVARRMAAAIARPRPELWPSRPSRWLASLATFFPGLADAAAARLTRGMAAD